MIKRINLAKPSSKFILLFILALTGNMLCYACQAVSKGKMPRWSSEKKAQKLTAKQVKVLHLTSVQQQKVSAINQEYAQSIDNLRAQPIADSKIKMEKLKTLHEQRDDQYELVLDPGQYKYWNDLEMKIREKLKTYRTRRREKILAEAQKGDSNSPDGQTNNK